MSFAGRHGGLTGKNLKLIRQVLTEGIWSEVVSRGDLARRYGYFLDCMNRRGLLDPNKAAGGHVTPENVDAYLAELRVRVGSVTVQGSIYKLRRACELIDPAVTCPGSPTSKKISRWICGHVQRPTGG